MVKKQEYPWSRHLNSFTSTALAQTQRRLQGEAMQNPSYFLISAAQCVTEPPESGGGRGLRALRKDPAPGLGARSGRAHPTLPTSGTHSVPKWAVTRKASQTPDPPPAGQLVTALLAQRCQEVQSLTQKELGIRES